MARWSLRRPFAGRRTVALALGVTLVGGALGVPVVSGLAGAATTLTTTNLVGGATLSLTSGTGSWTGTNVAKLTTKLWPASGSLVITSKAAGSAVVQTGTGRRALAATAGQVYSGSFKVQAKTVGAKVRPFLAWYDAAGAELAQERVLSAQTTDVVGTWTGTIVSGIAPSGARYVALGAIVPTATAGETHYLATPSLTAGGGGSRDLVGPLHTAGNRVYDANGAVVTLRGVNRSGTYNSAPDTLSQYDVNRIKAWGGNAVRITIGQHVWMPGCATYDPATRGIVDQAVKWVNAAGMLAILDLQWTAPTCESGGQNPMPDAKSVLFWQDVAAVYRNAPLVAFDLFNEPHDVSDDVWANGGTATTATGVTYQAVGMLKLYNTVRNTGAENLVIVNGLGWASTWPTTAPLPGTTNVVYGVHAYNCGSPTTCTYGTGISWMLDRFVSPGRSVPIMVSEFGWPATGVDAQTFNRNVISFAEAQGWGWMPWTWPVNGNCDPVVAFDLIAKGSCVEGGTYQPAPAGMPILSGLRANS
jgi:hypothetical protein